MLNGCLYKTNYIIIILSHFFLDYSITLYLSIYTVPLQYILSTCTVNNTGLKSKSVTQGIPSRWLLCTNLQLIFGVKQGSFRKPGSSKYFQTYTQQIHIKKAMTCTSTLFMNYMSSTKRKLTAATGLLGSHRKKDKRTEK